MQDLATFQIYNASAGSGKTFTLVKEYLKVLLLSEDVFRFQKVLAITFTNKAANEMKERVLNNLHAFSEGKETEILPIILKDTSLNKSIIKERSNKILNAILQNYTAFSITTIDSFTHKIIKNFAFDLGLSLNFEVEMDAYALLNEAVHLLISKIGTNQELTKVLIDFSLDKIDDNTSWDIVHELNEFAKILLNEDDTKHFRKLANKKLADFTELRHKLQKHQQNIKKRLKEIGEEGLQVIEIMNLEHKDFYYSLLPKHFLSLKNNPEITKFFDQSKLRERIEENTFYSKSKSDDVKTAIEGILPQLLDLYTESETLFKHFTLNKLTLKSIIPLAVLNNINNELTLIKEENNIRLNAEFNQLIYDQIKHQPAPFIYEKIGQRFMHYFIDEMQDTSILQWQNLTPLISNALSQENSSLLLVGDGKQAIYRWRGGKAEQFIGLGEGEDNPFHIPKKKETLATNFRSYSEIINFNNSFFQHTSIFFQNKTYKQLFINGSKQIESTKKGGFVSLSFLEKEEEKENELLKYPKKVLEKINALKSDFSLHEICILVRKKKDGISIANFLSENGIPIISSETLLLQNNSKVNFIILVLHATQHPKDQEAKFEILCFLHNHFKIRTPLDEFLHLHIKSNNYEIFKELEKNGVTFNQTEFFHLPFYEKVEEIIRGFQLINSSDAYIQFFLDVVIEQQRKDINIQDFLDFWQEKKHTLSITISETSDAVQIMTVHKSKGLEFPVVIFPYDLDIYKQVKPKIWLNKLPENFESFNELLVPFHKELKYVNNRGLEIYQEQRSALELDNFNLLYVALTRAIEQLYIITEKRITSKEGENVNYYSGIFINYLKENGRWDSNKSEYQFGNIKRISTIKKQPQKEENQTTFISSHWREHNIIMLASASKLWNTKQEKAIEYGNLIHEIMSKIIIKEDAEKVIKEYKASGELSKEIFLAIEKNIQRIVNHPKLNQYFTEKYTIYNEREIINYDGQIIIPDRLVFNQKKVVIIDYKTGEPSISHQQQLLNYANSLTILNFKVEKKILVYINQREIQVKEI